MRMNSIAGATDGARRQDCIQPGRICRVYCTEASGEETYEGRDN